MEKKTKSVTFTAICQTADTVSLRGIIFTKEGLLKNVGRVVPVYDDFKLDKKIGRAKLIFKKGALYTRLWLKEKTDKVPAVCVKIRKSDKKEKVYKSFKVFSIGMIDKNTHADPVINDKIETAVYNNSESRKKK